MQKEEIARLYRGGRFKRRTVGIKENQSVTGHIAVGIANNLSPLRLASDVSQDSGCLINLLRWGIGLESGGSLTFKPDRRKLAALVASGDLEASDVAACMGAESYAIKVEAAE